MGKFIRLASRRARGARYWALEARCFSGRARRFERWMQHYQRRAERRVAVEAELEDWGMQI